MSISNVIKYVYVYDCKLEDGIGLPKNMNEFEEYCVDISKVFCTKLNENDLKTVQKDEYLMHCRKQEGKIFCCVSKKDKEKSHFRICYGFLEVIADLDVEVEEKGLAELALKEQYKYFNDPRNDAIAKCSIKLEEIKDIMVENIDKILSNVAKLEEIKIDAEELQAESHEFERSGTGLSKEMIWRNLVLGGIVVAILLCIVISFVFFVILLVAILEFTIGD